MLIQLYSTNHYVMREVIFKEGINIILGKIDETTKDKKDENSHSLGKTFFIKIINYMLLKKEVNNDYTFSDNFKKKLKEKIKDEKFYIFLEIKINNKYITIRRNVLDEKDVALICKDYSEKLNNELYFDYQGLDNCKEVISKIYNFNADSSIRNIIPFILRSQNDYDNLLGNHSDYQRTSYVFALLYMYGININDIINISNNLKELKNNYQEYKNKLFKRTSNVDLNKKKEEIINQKIQLETQLEKFRNDLFNIDKTKASSLLIDEINFIDNKLDEFKKKRYEINGDLNSLIKTLNYHDEKKELNQIKKFLQEVNFLYNNENFSQLDDLILFQRKIKNELSDTLNKEKVLLEKELNSIIDEIQALEKERSSLLNKDIDKGSIVNEVITIYEETINTAKELSNEEQKLEELNILKEIDSEINDFHERKEVLYLKSIVENPLSIPQLKQIFTEIQNLLNKIVSKKIRINIIPTKDYTSINNVKLSYENKGEESDQSKGNSDGKILIIFHDLSLISNQNVNKSLNFVIHDSIFDSMEDREKRLYECIKNYIANKNIQYIFTAIDKQMKDIEQWENNIRIVLTENQKLFSFDF